MTRHRQHALDHLADLHGELQRNRAQLSDLHRTAMALRNDPDVLRRSLISLDDNDVLVVARRPIRTRTVLRRSCYISAAVTAFGCTYGTQRRAFGSVTLIHMDIAGSSPRGSWPAG